MKTSPLKKCLGAFAATFVTLSLCARAGPDVSGTTARPSPDWLRNGTIYEIFPRDFSAAGNLDGVTAKLDELHSLGVTILWLMPVHPIGEKFRKGELGSPYSIQDYYAIDPNYGTLDDFKKLVAGAHQRGMKVIMDLVANHTAWDSVMMKHPDFYKHDTQGRMIPPVPEWTDVAAINYGNPALRQYMIAMLQYWIQTCDVDGYRCDTAAMVPTEFWEQARPALIKVKPDIILLAEASKPELLTNAFDIDYSWPLLSTVKDVFVQNAPASNVRRSWQETRAQFPKNALHMRISDDHDETRAVTRYGFDGALAASALMFTLDGVPLIYNGMETGDTNETDGGALFAKQNISWQTREHPELRNTYHDLIQLRHQYAAFRNSRVDWLHNSDENRLLTFLRVDDKDELLITINCSSRPLAGKVNLKNAGGFVPVKISGLQSSADVPLPALQLNGFEWRIYHRVANSSHPASSVAAKGD
jgi:cyclomaltodextrinase